MNFDTIVIKLNMKLKRKIKLKFKTLYKINVLNNFQYTITLFLSFCKKISKIQVNLKNYGR